MEIQQGDEIEVLIEDLGTRGEGIGKYGGKTVFVPKALPTEKVLARVKKNKKSYILATLEKCLVSSKDRNFSPPCPYFPRCGGCQIMHLNYDAQLKQKHKRVFDALRRIGGIKTPPSFSCLPSPKIYGYRNKMQHPTMSEGKTGRKIGLFREGTHELVDIETCLIHNAFGDNLYTKVRKILLGSEITFYDEKSKKGELRYLTIRTSPDAKRGLITLVATKGPTPELRSLAKKIDQLDGVGGVVFGENAKESNAIFPTKIERLEGRGELKLSLLGIEMQLSPFSFFQVNTEAAGLLYQKAYEFAELAPFDLAVDAYSGIGTFAIYLAKKGCRVVGIEAVESAVKDAKAAARYNGVEVDFVQAKVEDFASQGTDTFTTLKLTAGSMKALFLNPPRKGCHGSVLQWISEARPLRVIYTSCDPATLARDVKILTESGYELTKLQAFDLFPQTMHVETIALLKRSGVH